VYVSFSSCLSITPIKVQRTFAVFVGTGNDQFNTVAGTAMAFYSAMIYSYIKTTSSNISPVHILEMISTGGDFLHIFSSRRRG
jgi:hypothetical protein